MRSAAQRRTAGNASIAARSIRVDRILYMLADALAAGERIELRGFASFSLY
ncbi:HU family DNA-binding protein [Acidithiobacillus ferrivorans]|uniref:hypothetical protein n=1 Tax=Acidithiobacillus ferrivorans TaxID=160808 RepID=UPI000A71DC66|nr:hypothetical protein [Acidithiobacillus ferrivorans]